MNAGLTLPVSEKKQRVESLRTLLAERFAPARPKPSCTLFRTGISKWDEATGGIEQSGTTEVCGPAGNCAILLDGILESASAQGLLIALVDGGASFEPEDYNATARGGMLWVRSQNPQNALQATDLLLRDGNLPLIALDLHGFTLRQLCKIPASTWHRFARLLEQNRSALLVFNPQPLVEGCRTRVTSQSRCSLKEMHMRRRDLMEALPLQIFTRNTQPLRVL